MGGWGNFESGFSSDYLLAATLRYEGHCLSHKPSVLCAGSPDASKRIGPCQGDSGGPLVCKADDKRYFVAGVLMYGSPECGTSHDYFADVYYYLDWIEKTLAGKADISNFT